MLMLDFGLRSSVFGSVFGFLVSTAEIVSRLSRMSYNTHQKSVLDPALPISHRFSHLRSCALLVARLLKQQRSEIVAQIRERTGINIEHSRSENELLTALESLNEIRAAARKDSETS